MDQLPEPISGRLLALLAPHAARQAMLALAAQLAWRGPLRVLDCGNRFNAYEAARALRRLGAADLHAALGRISVARAFTCYQVARLLDEATPEPLPTLALDLLDTFYDESVSLADRRRLLGGCLERLRGLSRRTVVVVSLRPPRPPEDDPTGLLQAVRETADQVWFPEELPPALPLRLF